MSKPPLRRCAIYTRKSHEEGLEQEFNSLDAQREASAAYITSQKHEGWQIIKTQYNDGGFSGGNINRPALQQLLADIEAEKIDVIVVYKVDRLSRSLHDFAKMVELFDKHNVSFVSVTQQFNTTTSMGRLTLNVLLSFAQFEREVTGERIRDKIAASKKKGIWMGGPVPLGYDAADRKLIINPKEAETVRYMFQRYRELGCVRLLAEELEHKGIQSKARFHKDGSPCTRRSFARGHIYVLLSNPIYIGQIRHKDACHPGLHEPIINAELWEQVQQLMRGNAVNGKSHTRKTTPSILTGKLFDVSGDRLIPSHAVKKGKRYRYYVSQSLKTGTAEQNRHGWRLPAYEIEQLVMQSAKAMLSDHSAIAFAYQGADIENHELPHLLKAAEETSQRISNDTEIFLKFIKHVELRRGSLSLTLALNVLLPKASISSPITITHEIPMQMKRCGVEMRMVIEINGSQAPRVDDSLIKAIARAHRWFGELASGKTTSISAIAIRENIDKGYVSHLLNLAFLAPDITETIIAGKQPADLSVNGLTKRIQLPVEWSQQRRTLGFTQPQR
jgi:site-specific DNA recombinase